MDQTAVEKNNHATSTIRPRQTDTVTGAAKGLNQPEIRSSSNSQALPNAPEGNYSHQESSNIVVATNIRKNFPIGAKQVDAVRGISLNIARDDFVVIYGPSGCGKTTLLNILTGVDTPTAGHLKVKDVDILSLNEEERGIFRSKNIGIVHQMFYWIKSLNVIENVAMPLVINGMKYRDALIRAERIMTEIKIEQFAHQEPNQLSGGEQQRVSIARALVGRPDIIVADEPTGNLDSSASDRIMGLLSMLHSQLNRTIILVTHNPAYWEIGSIRIEMKDGQKIKETRHAPLT